MILISMIKDPQDNTMTEPGRDIDRKSDDYDECTESRTLCPETSKKFPSGCSMNLYALRNGCYVRYMLLALTVGLALWGFVDICSSLVRLCTTVSAGREQWPPCWCGKSNEEAMAMDCRYDYVAVDWLPDDCVDDELVEEFDLEFDRSGSGPGNSWSFFEFDPFMSTGTPYKPINASEIDEFARNGKDYYTTREWHVARCLYTWRKQYRMSLGGLAMEPWNNKEEHIEHCATYILDAVRFSLDAGEVETLILGENRHTSEMLK